MELAACLSQVPSSVPRFMVPVSLMTPMLFSRSSRRMHSPVPAAGVLGAFAAAAGEAQLTGNPNRVQRLGGSQGRRQTGPTFSLLEQERVFTGVPTHEYNTQLTS